jgi:hypothetical protein
MIRTRMIVRVDRGGGAWLVACAVLATIALALGAAAVSHARDAASDGESRIEMRVSLYSWLTAQHGTVTQGGRTVKVDVGLDDVFDLLGNGDALGGAGYFDLYDRPTHLGGFVNAVGSVVDSSAKQSRADLGLDSSLASVEWGVTTGCGRRGSAASPRPIRAMTRARRVRCGSRRSSADATRT